MSQFSKATLLGLATIFLGAAVYLLLNGLDWEENTGLDILFKLRGQQPAPGNIVIVAIDKQASDEFSLPNDSAQWPRSIHAQLVEKLARAQARSIIFDIFFKADKGQTDKDFANSISSANNVILFSHLKREILSLETAQAAHAHANREINLEHEIAPTPVLARAPVALAPFALPKYPHKVTRFWTFRVPSGETPNLPAVSLQFYLKHVLPDFIDTMKQLDPSVDQVELYQQSQQPRGLTVFMQSVRTIFKRSDILRTSWQQLPLGNELKVLFALYSGYNQRYLNFYGPPRSIATLSYAQALRETPDAFFKDKAIFVGFSDQLQPEQKDNFYTVYSQRNGLDLSGVEIAATAFANLLYEKSIKPINLIVFISIITIFGLLLAYVSRMLQTTAAIIATLLLAASYFALTSYLFNAYQVWIPFMVPLLVMSPFALFVSLTWHYYDTNRERQRIRQAFGYYLPENVITDLARSSDKVQTDSQLMYGICLATDGEQYTSLAEQHSPEELSKLLNNYYQLLFEPVRKHKGIISDVVGDAMLAIWTSYQPDAYLKQAACEAALEIIENISKNSNEHAIPTRIGLHAGEIVLGNVGAMDHFEYRAVGDIVNTTNRIQGLNKQLNTQVIISEDTLRHLDNFITRELGVFRLAGKRKPVKLYELICTESNVNNNIKTKCSSFHKALVSFKQGHWETCQEQLKNVISHYPDDGPALFYIERCQQLIDNPPGEDWQPVITLSEK